MIKSKYAQLEDGRSDGGAQVEPNHDQVFESNFEDVIFEGNSNGSSPKRKVFSSILGRNTYQKLNEPVIELYQMDNSSVSDLNLIETQHFSTSRGTSGIFNAVLNFTNSIVGAGIIGLPYSLSQAGFGFGVLLITGIALLVDWSVCLLVRTSKLSGTSSYQDLVEFCFGKPGLIFISLFQFLFAFGAMCAYSVIVGDTVPVVSRHFLGGNISPFLLFITSRRFVIIITTLGVSLPLSLYRDISKLAKASAFAMIALLFILVIVLIEGPPETSTPFEMDFIKAGALQAIGVIGFAFVCHHNSFLIYGSLSKPTLNRWELVTHLSTGISWFLSMLMAVSGFASFGYETEGNILNNFNHKNLWVNLARLAFAANMFTTFPLECFVCKEVVENYFFPNHEVSDRVNYLVTSGLTLAALLISLSTCDLGVVLEITGCFSATALAFILPPACFLKLSSETWFSFNKIMSLLSVILGILVMITSTSLALYNAYTKQEMKICNW